MRALTQGFGVAVWLSSAFALGGCFGSPLSSGGGAAGAKAAAPTQPTELAKCRVASSHENPLVTEWPASEKANLEARLREGGVVVAYAGCSMRLLPQCRVKGSYGWRRTTTSTDVVEIQNADDLYAKLPLGAVSLEGELERSGRIAVQTTVSGQLELRGWDKFVSTDPACAGATHVVGALSVGSFKLRSGGALSARGGAGVAGIGAASVGTRSAESVIREAGNPEACKEATDEAPTMECGSPVQVFLWPLPKHLADRGAPGTVKVAFLSATSDRNWDVVVGDRVICKTPCEKWVDPSIPYGFRFDRGFLQRDEEIEVPDLRDQGGPVDVRAHPRQDGKLIGGIVMTAFGGMGVMTGLTLMAVGCGDEERKGMCTAGAITAPIGLALAIPGVILMLNSGAYAEVGPAGQAPKQTSRRPSLWRGQF